MIELTNGIYDESAGIIYLCGHNGKGDVACSVMDVKTGISKFSFPAGVDAARIIYNLSSRDFYEKIINEADAQKQAYCTCYWCGKVDEGILDIVFEDWEEIACEKCRKENEQ